MEADRALLHEERLVGDGERDVHRLLDEDHGDALFLELLDDGEELLDDERCEPERELVDHEHVGLGEERHREREHLLLTTGQLRRRVVQPVRSAGKRLSACSVAVFAYVAVAPVHPDAQP